jgi:hypothetical protein
VGAAELDHEVVDDAMKVQAVIEAALRELDEVARRDGHLVDEELDRERAERGLAGRRGVRHGCRPSARAARREGTLARAKGVLSSVISG